MAQRLRVHYAKRGRLRFTSHRDIQRAFERALRRAAVPMAYSAGFSPHPKVSWAGAAPTGVASEAEYVEVSLTRSLDVVTLRRDLDAALPPGLDVLEIVEARATQSLPDRLEASIWQVMLDGVSVERARQAVAAFLGETEVVVERLTKQGVRAINAREPVIAMTVVEDLPGETGTAATTAGQPASSPCAILRMVVRHMTPAVRPDDVLSGLGRVDGLVPRVPPVVTRVAQGPLDAGADAVADPLEPDRVALASRQ